MCSNPPFPIPPFVLDRAKRSSQKIPERPTPFKRRSGIFQIITNCVLRVISERVGPWGGLAMAAAVPRQFEIAKAAAGNEFSTKIQLATELNRRTRSMISQKESSAFQRIIEGRPVALKVSTIISYINVAQNIGIIDRSLKITGPLKQSTQLRGFSNYLRECLGIYSDHHRFSVAQIQNFLSKRLDMRPFPIEPVTPWVLYAELNPNVSEFTYNQCLLMFDELGNDKFRVRSVRLLLHKDIIWGAG